MVVVVSVDAMVVGGGKNVVVVPFGERWAQMIEAGEYKEAPNSETYSLDAGEWGKRGD